MHEAYTLIFVVIFYMHNGIDLDFTILKCVFYLSYNKLGMNNIPNNINVRLLTLALGLYYKQSMFTSCAYDML